MSRFIMPRQGVKGQNLNPADGAQLFFHNVGLLTNKDTYSDATFATPNTNPVTADATGLFGDIFIQGNYDVSLKDKNGVQLWGPETVSELVTGDGAQVVVHAFDTLAAAVADDSLVDGWQLNIKERTTGNGGGGMWDVVLSSTVTENTYNIVQCTGVATLSLVLREELNIVIATQWGIVADGSLAGGTGTDNSTVLQYIIDNVQTFGAVVRFPSGPIGLGSTINQGLSGNQRIKFEGVYGLDGTAIFPLTGFSGTTMWQLPASSGDTDRVANSEWSDIDFAGKSRVDYCMKGNGNHLLFRDCRFREASVAGTDIRFGYEITWDHCAWFQNTIDGCLQVDQNNQNTFLSCQFVGNGGLGTWVRGSNIIAFYNCIFEGNAEAGLLIGPMKGVTLSACYFEANAADGLDFTTPVVNVKADIILNGGATRDEMAVASPVNGPLISNSFTSMARANGCHIYAIAANALTVIAPVLNEGSTNPIVRAYGSTTSSSQYFRCPNMKLGAGVNFDDKIIIDNSTTAFSGETGIVFDDVDVVNIAPDDLFSWTQNVAGTAGDWQRSTELHDLGVDIPTWEFASGSASTSQRMGFKIDPADYPHLIGKPCQFTISAKADASNTPTITLAGNGGTKTTSSTDWVEISLIFNMPASGVQNFDVKKSGGTGAAFFANPVLCELGCDSKLLYRRIPKLGASFIQANDGTTYPPAVGTWIRGDRIYDVAPSSSGKIGEVCVASGTPGTWRGYGAIDAT